MQLNKSELRKTIVKQRRSLSPEKWKEKSDRLCQNLQSLPTFRSAQTILAYFSVRQEPDLSLLFKDNSRRWGFPRCVDKSLEWHLVRWLRPDGVQSPDLLEKNSYGIKEPLPDAPKIEAKQVDLILVPAVACDRRGYRLGYGGGYYDRLFSSSEWQNIPKIGIVFDFAYFSELPNDPWDKKLDFVCTENESQIQ
ncbi:MAG: 5-formyltetrahydrofolate cyclo-ligase [Xenococcaceae cyanobacterium]